MGAINEDVRLDNSYQTILLADDGITGLDIVIFIDSKL